MGDLLDFRKTEQDTRKLHKTLLSLSRESREDRGTAAGNWETFIHRCQEKKRRGRTFLQGGFFVDENAKKWHLD